MFRITAIASVIAMVLAAASCGGGPISPTELPTCSQDCVPPPPPEISVSPTSDTLGPGGVRKFQATLTNAAGAVTWKVEEGAAGGTVTSDGLYVAPIATGTFHVTAIAAANGSESTAKLTVVPSGFVATGDMRAARSGHTATLLADGRVLIVGGGDGSSVLASAELFDPVAGTFSSTKGNLKQARKLTALFFCLGGKVLITGGDDSTVSLSSAELFDPVAETFSAAGDMTTTRAGATATLLRDGRVLIAGGVDNNDALLATAELYDRSVGTFSDTAGNMTSVRWSHTATLLANGQVLLAGGRSNFSPNVHSASANCSILLQTPSPRPVR